MVSANDLIQKFQYALNNKWGYIANKSGQLWTQSDQDKATDQVIKDYGQQWVGHNVADCSGLFSWAFKELGGYMYHGSNTMYRKYCTETGPIDKSTIKPGTAVFKIRSGSKYSDGKDYYHVGLYVGDNKVIEAKGTRNGVVTSKLSDWANYGVLKGVDYDKATEDQNAISTGSAVVDVPNNGTVNVRKSPKNNATILDKLREGTSVDILAVNGEWAYVKYPSYGYIKKEFLRGDL